jgi:aspartate/methionine/tyrosine aminotransferase
MEHMVSGDRRRQGGLAAITGPRMLQTMLAEYERRAVVQGLNEMDGVSCIPPEATFYAFPNISKVGLSSWDLAKYLVQEHKVALIPGSVFGENGEGYLRLSFAASEGNLREGLSRIRAGVEALLESGRKGIRSH